MQIADCLPLSLLLLLPLLAAALLALALARPQWLTNLLGREQHLTVIIDTSASMAAPAGGVSPGSRLDAARERARALIGGLGGRDTLTLIAAGPEARLLDSAGPAGADRLLSALGGLRAGGVGSDIAGALTLAAADMQGQPAGQAIVITDAALPALDAELRGAPEGIALRWEQVGSSLPNRALITLAARPRSGGGPTEVYARATNYGSASVRSVIRLYGDGQLLDTRLASFPPQGDVELTWTVPAGVALLRAEVDGNDGLPADDAAAISLAVARPLRTLLVSASPAVIERALRAVPGMSLRVLDPADYVGQELPDIDLTVLDGVLPGRWPPGAVLAINPPEQNSLLDVGNQIINPASGGAKLESSPDTAIFEGVSLGSVDFGPIHEIAPPDWAQELLSRDGRPLMLRGSVERSEVAIWAFDLAQSNLTSRLAFPLLLARTVRDLTPAPLPESALAGQAVELRPDPRADTVEITAPDGSVRRLAAPRGEAVPITLDDPGVYALRELAGADEVFAGQLPVNAGAARESDLTPRRLPAATAAPPPAASDPERDSRPIWPWLAGAALIVMLGEWVYVHARRSAVRSA
ncbi:VWA domain-containing protein [Oscillochloris sp. ZM17-4]|uniref:vWA domain-containing protein n=1 Tax=Oscillochloris sp. ZM17-4 TaxID=2866714 RepID=UPI001C72E7D1|nr:VWA domain-containing protein [Oscillochloris sp. ZM17-4]MBX0326080.1 VWA domain-containing protein [Oscillochloris sp. ZM17-4]